MLRCTYIQKNSCGDAARGFTLVEVLVGAAVFAVVSLASYQAYISVFNITSAAQARIAAIDLANERIEIIRNMEYGDIGIVNGLPNGVIPGSETFTRSGHIFLATTTIRSIDIPFDGQVGSTTFNDLSPADNKLVEIRLLCTNCKKPTAFDITTTVAPKSLETAATNGALFIRAFDANGVPVPGAIVNIVNREVTPNIVINDVTNTNGWLQIVDAPPGVRAYEITVSKDGFSTDKTYATSTGNPDPLKPHSTVVLQQVTQTSFSIDALSTLNIASLTSSCVPVGNVDFTMTGSKIIGNPDIYKTVRSLSTDSSGKRTLGDVEWDAYNFTVNDASHDLIGVSSLNPVAINPNSTQALSLIVAPRARPTVVVTVKDSATQLPLSDVTVTIDKGAYSSTRTTGRGFITQNTWEGGVGQDDFVDETKYRTSNGNVGVTTPVGEVKLRNTEFSGTPSYVADGWLESSTFDTGSESNFHQLVWSPADQPVAAGTTSVVFQIATNATNTATTTWVYKGPDGAEGSYYTSANSTISNAHDNDRFLRYKMYLSTASSTVTPNVSDTSFTFTSSCTPPGQVVFNSLDTGTYTVTASRSGYITSNTTVNVTSNSWNEVQVLLAQ